MSRTARTCASCTHFPRTALECIGVGECAMFERPAGFDYPACILHDLARDHHERKPLVARLVEAQNKS